MSLTFQGKQKLCTSLKKTKPAKRFKLQVWFLQSRSPHTFPPNILCEHKLLPISTLRQQKKTSRGAVTFLITPASHPRRLKRCTSSGDNSVATATEFYPRPPPANGVLRTPPSLNDSNKGRVTTDLLFLPPHTPLPAWRREKQSASVWILKSKEDVDTSARESRTSARSLSQLVSMYPKSSHRIDPPNTHDGYPGPRIAPLVLKSDI